MIIPLDYVLHIENATLTLGDDYLCPILTESIAQTARSYFQLGRTYLLGLIHEQGYIHCFNGPTILEWYKHNPVHPITRTPIDEIHIFAVNKLMGNRFQYVDTILAQPVPSEIGLLAQVCSDSPLKNSLRNAILLKLSSDMIVTHPVIASGFFYEISDPLFKNPYNFYKLQLPVTEQHNPNQLEFNQAFDLWESENPQNKLQAHRILSDLAERQDPFGYMFYAQALEEGLGGEVDMTLSRRYLKKAADCGIAQAQTQYGYKCVNGYVGKKNAREGREYLRKAAGNWELNALGYYAVILFSGIGGRKNSVLAHAYFLKAITFGSKLAHFEYGSALIEGAWGLRELEEGLFHIRYAADAGYAPAQISMAKIALEGDLVPHSRDLARHYLLNAQRKGNVEAEQILVENDLLAGI